MSATIKDASKKTGLSQGTISKYLNQKPVSPKNQEKIRQAIAELGYQVNPFARGLRTASSMTVGILVPDMGNVFSTAIIEQVENMLSHHQYSSIICFHHGDAVEEAHKLDFLLSRQVDGIILMPTEQTQAQGLGVTARQVPILVFNAVVPGLRCDTVLVDNRDATRQAVAACFDSGHMNVGLMVAAPNAHLTRQRLLGYRDAYQDRGFPVREDYLAVCSSAGKTSSYQAALELLREHREVTALIATGYRTVLGCKKALDQLAAESSRNVLLVGFDCEDIADILLPKISYIRFPAQQLAEEIVSLLVGRCTGKRVDEPQTLSIKSQFVSKF